MTSRVGVRTRGLLGLLTHLTLTLGGSLAVATAASAQAWVPPARVGSVHLVFQTVQHTGHLLADGSELEGFDSESRGVLVQLDYAVTDRFSISGGIPYLGAKYLGPEPSFFGLEVDDCHCWNTGWQDFSLTARYNLLDGPFALTSSVTYVFPSHSYGYLGEAVLGRNLDELQLAVDAGKRLDAVSPRLSVTGRYSYAFVEEVLDVSIDRSNLSLSVGWLFTSRLSASADLYWQRTHGGLDSTEFVTDELFLQFDRLLKDNSFHLGGTLVYSLPRADLFLSYVEFLDGTDTHTGHAVSVGIGWPFQL